jgi:hypothetical protein
VTPREWPVPCVVRVIDEDGDVWHATVLRAWVTSRTRRLTRVVLQSGRAGARPLQRRRVLRTGRVTEGDLAGLRVIYLGGEW